MKMVMKIVLGIIMITAILAMGATSFAESKKTPSTMQQISPAQQTFPAATAAHSNATISGSITVSSQVPPYIETQHCLVSLRVSSLTRNESDQVQSETLLDMVVTGGELINGCNYSVNVRKNAGVGTTIIYAVYNLRLQDGTIRTISGYQGPFHFDANITKNIVMH